MHERKQSVFTVAVSVVWYKEKACGDSDAIYFHKNVPGKVKNLPLRLAVAIIKFSQALHWKVYRVITVNNNRTAFQRKDEYAMLQSETFHCQTDDFPVCT